MLKKFEKPEMIIAKFDSKSIVVASGTAMDEATNNVGSGSLKIIGGSYKD